MTLFRIPVFRNVDIIGVHFELSVNALILIDDRLSSVVVLDGIGDV